ncbi:MAG: hypothetical protein QM726_16590 [Chitinophagaceae bacterium]
MQQYFCRLLMIAAIFYLPIVSNGQDNYTISTTAVSFNYTKNVKEEASTADASYSVNSMLTISGSNKNAPMVTNVDGAVQVSSKNSAVPSTADRQTNALIQSPFTTGMGNANYIKYSLIASKDASLSGNLFYKYSSSSSGSCQPSGRATLNTAEVPKGGNATISFGFQYDPINKIGMVNIGGSCASSKSVSGGCDHADTTFDADISGGVGATTDMAKSMYGYGMKSDPDAAYIQVTKTKSGYRINYHKETRDNNGARVVTEDLTAYIGQPEELYEAIITPYNFDYNNWLPTGPKVDASDDTKGDVSVQFYVDVHKKGDPSYKYPGMVKINWNLANVTNYPGFCNNYPKFTGTGFDTSPDLVFNPDMKQSTAFANGSVTNDYVSSGQCNASQAVAKIKCMDYAAWGKLSAVVTLEDGTPLNAVSSIEPNKNYVTLPLDKDENKLADKWEDDNNPGKHPLSWDEDDEPKEQRENGDGYTLWEEYRGFAAITPPTTDVEEKTIYVRTDTKHKDAFICDLDGLFKKYYEPYNPAQVTWHYLSKDKAQLIFIGQDKLHKKHRWVNFNTPDDMLYAHQYAMVLMKDDGTAPLDPNAAGITFSQKEYSDNYDADAKVDAKISDKAVYDNPQAGFIETRIYFGMIKGRFTPAVKNGIFKWDLNNLLEHIIGNNVRHEIGHYLGITHHDSGPRKDEFGNLRDALNTDGVADCLMRYDNPAEHNDVNYWTKDFSKYCRRGDSGFWWEYNPAFKDDGSKIILKPYTCNDNCFEQITVKSKPTN